MRLLVRANGPESLWTEDALRGRESLPSPLSYSPGNGCRWPVFYRFLGRKLRRFISLSGSGYCKSRAALPGIRRLKPRIFSRILLDLLGFHRVTANRHFRKNVAGREIVGAFWC